MDRTLFAALLVALLGACGGGTTASSVEAPGRDATATTKALEAGAAVLQARPPVEAINAYLDGFHFYNGRPQMQMEAHHYCTILNEDLIQCAIFDGNVSDAKLMGVEYIISATLFAGLPAQEKQLWHSHVHEVRSGQLIAPGIPDAAEHALMQKLVGSYGKTWHTWHTDLDKTLPLGVPQLMMGFTADGQVDPAMIVARDNRLNVNSADKRARRADIAAPAVLPGADAWQQGTVVQIPDPTENSHAHSVTPSAPPPQENARSSGREEP